MKSFVLRDFTFIFLIYGIYFGICLVVANLQGDMTEAWGQSSLLVLGVSLLCSVVWYVVGEWVMRPSTSRGSWYIFWFVLVLMILGTAVAVVILEPVPDLNLLFFLCGTGAYYLATMLFSPFHAKFLIWPSTHIRTW